MEMSKQTTPNQLSMKDHILFNLAVTCFWFAIYIYSPLFSVYLEKIGLSYSGIGVVLGGYGLTQIIFRFPLGILSDFLSNIRKHLFVSGFVVVLISCLLLIYFDSFIAVLLARLLAGVTASMWVMATVLYSYYFTPDKSARSMSTMQFNMVTTQLICMTSSGFLIHTFGWNFPFWLGAIAALLGLIFSLGIKIVHVPQTVNKISALDYVVQTNAISGLKMYTFLSLIGHAILFITVFGFSPIIAVSVGVSEQQFFWLMGAFFVPHALTSLGLMIYQFDHKYNKSIMVISFVLSALSLALIPTAEGLWTLSAYHALLGFFLGLIFPLLLGEVIRITPSTLKMSAMGFYQSFYSIGILLGPFIGGGIVDYFNVEALFYLAGAMTLLTAVVFALWKNQAVLK